MDCDRRGVYLMFVDNVRNSIGELDNAEYAAFLKRLRLVLKKNYQKNTKPSELKKRVDEFVEGKDPKIDYFESYLLTFDELYKNGAMNALNMGITKVPKTWRQLLLSVTDDRSLSAEVVEHLEDEEILKEMKALFFSSIEYCKDKNRDLLFRNLYHFNKFLKINSRE